VTDPSGAQEGLDQVEQAAEQAAQKTASAAAKAAAQGTPYSKSEVYKQLLALQAD